METPGNFLSCELLAAAIDGSGMTRKVLADDHLGISEGELSKLLASGRFRLELIDRLPPAIRADWQRRMDEAEDVSVREQIVIARALHALVDALTMLKGRRGRMAKAGM